MASNTLINNVIRKDKLRKIQGDTLKNISNILQNSFGPYGSTSCIKKEKALNQYSKDGHTILSNIYYVGIAEQSIKDDIESITRHIVKTVGDGTTSAVILSNIIFKEIVERLEPNMSPVQIQNGLNKTVKMINERIKSNARQCTLDDIYNICMISTNGNEEVSRTIQDIYKDFGMEVFIDVTPSTGVESMLKYYDGMTINTGFSDSIYVTNPHNNTATVDHPSIYFFEHPIDTREMSVYLDAIVMNNIIKPYSEKRYEAIVPTVIVAPKISQDLCGTMDMITNAMTQLPAANKLPILFITDTHQIDEILDLSKLCGAKPIRKYIDANIYAHDVELGIAPTPENVIEWCGICDQVVADSAKTKFINPQNMYDENGEKTVIYKNLLDYLETELRKETDNGANIREIGTLKRRIHSLKSNMVEYFVGGITMADRDSLRDLIEDAVLNCRSAAINGIGWAANCEALFALHDIVVTEGKKDILTDIIYNAYRNLVITLYKTADSKFSDQSLNKIIEARMPINIRSGKHDSNVVTSIESDMTIMDTVAKIIGIMATCNQFVLPTAMHNVYDNM